MPMMDDKASRRRTRTRTRRKRIVSNLFSTFKVPFQYSLSRARRHTEICRALLGRTLLLRLTPVPKAARAFENTTQTIIRSDTSEMMMTTTMLPKSRGGLRTTTPSSRERRRRLCDEFRRKSSRREDTHFGATTSSIDFDDEGFVVLCAAKTAFVKERRRRRKRRRIMRDARRRMGRIIAESIEDEDEMDAGMPQLGVIWTADNNDAAMEDAESDEEDAQKGNGSVVRSGYPA